jgi:hypothetical protein
MPLDANTLINDFRKVAEIAGISLSQNSLTFESLPAPHTPPSALPKGKTAIYVFLWKGECLKVGKVGPNSHARYTHQHYSPLSSKSNLAKSILSAHSTLGIPSVSESNIGAWIKSNVDRINFLLDARCGIPTLSLLEGFLQCRLKPRFEGFESQRAEDAYPSEL